MCENCANHATPDDVPIQPNLIDVGPADPVECGHCGNTFERNTMTDDPDGDPTCEDCYSEHVSTCDQCNSTVWSSDTRMACNPGGRREQCVCDECATICDGCNGSFYGALSSSPSGHTSYCDDCHSERFTSCDDCGDCIERYDACCTDDGCYCEVCHRAHSADATGVNDYGYSPKPVFHTNQGMGICRPAGLRFFGLEVETELPDNTDAFDNADAIKGVTRADLWYAKEDGSLENGVEFVSHPGTLRFWRKTGFAWAAGLASDGWKSWDTTTCGIHIHVSRDSLTQLGWYKAAILFRNSSRLVRRAARRQPNRYCENRPNETTSEIVGKMSGRDRGERYQAINFCNSKTVEFRIFKGTLNPASIARNVEFVNAVCEFANTQPITDMTGRKFVQWLATDARRIIGFKVAASLHSWLSSSVASLETSNNGEL